MIDLRLLEFAVALDQHRHFGRAAQALGVSQPTFSRGIAGLEAALRVRLFDRSTRAVEPTAEGLVLLGRARRLLAEATELSVALDDQQGLRSGRVVIGVGPFPLEISVTDAVVRLASRHPLLEIEVHEGSWREFGPKLLSGEVDVAVMESSIVDLDPRFDVEAMQPHKGCFYCRRAHPLGDRARVSLDDILDFPLVGIRLPSRFAPLLTPGRRSFTLDPVTGDVLPRILTTSMAAGRAIVSRTDGIGIAVPRQLEEEVARGRLIILSVDAAFLQTAYGITFPRGRSISPGARAFAATLREVESEIVDYSSRREVGAGFRSAAGASPRGTGPRRRSRPMERSRNKLG